MQIYGQNWFIGIVCSILESRPRHWDQIRDTKHYFSFLGIPITVYTSQICTTSQTCTPLSPSQSTDFITRMRKHLENWGLQFVGNRLIMRKGQQRFDRRQNHVLYTLSHLVIHIIILLLQDKNTKLIGSSNSVHLSRACPDI